MTMVDPPFHHRFLVRTRLTFCCALRLYVPGLTEEENFHLFGPCSWESYHGHNYDLEVCVSGNVDPVTGMVTDFARLDRIVREHVFDTIDHRNLNKDVPWLKGLVPTTENVAAGIWSILEPLVRPAVLHSITLGERDSNIVTYFGPGGV
jgi:6-pyruvoyltetrahydropterin/6-carboxytetrahydropterin synthase